MLEDASTSTNLTQNQLNMIGPWKNLLAYIHSLENLHPWSPVFVQRSGLISPFIAQLLRTQTLSLQTLMENHWDDYLLFSFIGFHIKEFISVPSVTPNTTYTISVIQNNFQGAMWLL